MKFGKLTAGILSVMLLGAVSMQMPLSAKAIRQETPVTVTIDRKTVTAEEAKAGVLIYVKVDTPLLNTVIFSTHVDDRCQYTAITDSGLISMISGDNPELSVQMVSQDSVQEKNVTQFFLAQAMPSAFMATNPAFECMNLVALYVTVPEEEAVSGAHFDIEYVSGVANATEAWRNSYSGEAKTLTGSVTFEAQDYLVSGMLQTQNGWIEIEGSPSQSGKMGDLDGNGEVSIIDVLLLNQYLLSLHQIPEERLPLADVNHDGSINDSDAITILKSLVGLATL